MHSYSDQLLLPYDHPSREFCSTDSPELFYYNLQHQPPNWLYRSQSVYYAWNSNGYRAPEWSHVNWSKSNIIFGCSHALGVGVAYAHTISGLIPDAICLAQPGISITNIQYNTLRMIDHGIRPRSVQIIIPELTRSVYWAYSDWLDLTAHDFDQRSQQLSTSVQQYYAGLLGQWPMAEVTAEIAIRSTQALWSAQGVQCKLWRLWIHRDLKWIPQLARPSDSARDYDLQGTAHPGPQTHQQWADQIKEQL